MFVCDSAPIYSKTFEESLCLASVVLKKNTFLNLKFS